MDVSEELGRVSYEALSIPEYFELTSDGAIILKKSLPVGPAALPVYNLAVQASDGAADPTQVRYSTVIFN